ncbi:hypothetical protein ES708_32710 [subsurface metagenome]
MLVLFLKLPFHLFAFGDITEDALSGYHLVPDIARGGVAFDQNPSAVLGQESGLYVVDGLSADNPGKRFLAVRQGIGADNVKQV